MKKVTNLCVLILFSLSYITCHSSTSLSPEVLIDSNQLDEQLQNYGFKENSTRMLILSMFKAYGKKVNNTLMKKNLEKNAEINSLSTRLMQISAEKHEEYEFPSILSAAFIGRSYIVNFWDENVEDYCTENPTFLEQIYKNPPTPPPEKYIDFFTESDVKNITKMYRQCYLRYMRLDTSELHEKIIQKLRKGNFTHEEFSWSIPKSFTFFSAFLRSHCSDTYDRCNLYKALGVETSYVELLKELNKWPFTEKDLEILNILADSMKKGSSFDGKWLNEKRKLMIPFVKGIKHLPKKSTKND